MDVSRFIFSETKPDTCPVCGSSRIAEIVYGMPSPELLNSPDYGVRYVTGGCIVSDANPAWCCLECDGLIYPEGARKSLEDMQPPS
jgi:hypothetical protein